MGSRRNTAQRVRRGRRCGGAWASGPDQAVRHMRMAAVQEPGAPDWTDAGLGPEAQAPGGGDPPVEGQGGGTKRRCSALYSMALASCPSSGKIPWEVASTAIPFPLQLHVVTELFTPLRRGTQESSAASSTIVAMRSGVSWGPPAGYTFWLELLGQHPAYMTAHAWGKCTLLGGCTWPLHPDLSSWKRPVGSRASLPPRRRSLACCA